MDRNRFCSKFCRRYHRRFYLCGDCEGRQSTIGTGDRRFCAWALAGYSLGDGRKGERSSAWRRHSHVRGDAKSKRAALGAVYFSDYWRYWGAGWWKIETTILVK